MDLEDAIDVAAADDAVQYPDVTLAALKVLLLATDEECEAADVSRAAVLRLHDRVKDDMRKAIN